MTLSYKYYYRAFYATFFVLPKDSVNNLQRIKNYFDIRVAIHNQVQNKKSFQNVFKAKATNTRMIKEQIKNPVQTILLEN